MKSFPFFVAVSALLSVGAEAREDLPNGRIKDSGLIIPLDNDGMYLRNSGGQIEVREERHVRASGYCMRSASRIPRILLLRNVRLAR